MTIISINKTRLGDLGKGSLLYFIDPTESLTAKKVLIIAGQRDYPWDKRLQSLLERRIIPEKTEYIELEYYSPKYAPPLLEREYPVAFKENKITVDEKLAMVPTGKMIVPKMETKVSIMGANPNHLNLGLMPNIYFTSKTDLEEWVKKGSHILLPLVRKK